MMLTKGCQRKELHAAGGIIAALVFSSLINQAHAGLSGLTYFSRANCATINESISWDARAPHTLWTGTAHYRNGVYDHGFNSGWAGTWGDRRSRAGDSHASFGWRVIGYHWEYTPERGVFQIGTSQAVDCNLSQW